MQLQIALDRLQLDAALQLAAQLQQSADWIEVGTSLIKEFGMESVRRMCQALPDTAVLADVKTNDNARYEFELCYAAGAGAATVMGAVPDTTLDLCMAVARERRKQVMIDLLGTDAQRQRELLKYRDAIFAVHVSKDAQEAGEQGTEKMVARIPDWAPDYQVAIAGGISLEDIPALGARLPTLTVIVGSAITGAPDPVSEARKFVAALQPYRQVERRMEWKR